MVNRERQRGRPFFLEGWCELGSRAQSTVDGGKNSTSKFRGGMVPAKGSVSPQLIVVEGPMKHHEEWNGCVEVRTDCQ